VVQSASSWREEQDWGQDEREDRGEYERQPRVWLLMRVERLVKRWNWGRGHSKLKVPTEEGEEVA
jgi:hypothetical protein